MAVLKRDMKLKIDDFGAEKQLRDDVRAYHKLLLDYMARMGQMSVVHTRSTYEPMNWSFA